MVGVAGQVDQASSVSAPFMDAVVTTLFARWEAATSMAAMETNRSASVGVDSEAHGGAGDDKIAVSDNNNSIPMTLSGGTGNDILTGGYSSGIYLFNRGDGADTTSDNSGGFTSTDKVAFSLGIARDHVSLERSRADLIVTVANIQGAAAGDKITIRSWYLSNNSQIERLEFESEEILTSVQIELITYYVVIYYGFFYVKAFTCIYNLLRDRQRRGRPTDARGSFYCSSRASALSNKSATGVG